MGRKVIYIRDVEEDLDEALTACADAVRKKSRERVTTAQVARRLLREALASKRIRRAVGAE